MQTKIRGNLQIQAGTILDAQIASGANINVTKLNKLVLTPDVGTFTLTDVLDLGGSFAVRSSASPGDQYDLTNKSYVDAVAAGFGPKRSCRVSTTAELSATYDNGSSGVGATLTGTTTALVLDSVALALDDRVLVRHQSTGGIDYENGIYTVTTVGSGSEAWVLTRASDFDNTPSGEIQVGDFTFIEEGTLYEGYGFTQVDFDANALPAPVIGTDVINFTLFSSPNSTSAGNGLSLSGTVININAGAGLGFSGDDLVVNVDGSTITINADTLGVPTGGISATELAANSVTSDKISNGSVTAIKLAADVAGDGLASALGVLSVNVDGSSIEIITDILQVKALGITDAMLAGSISDGKLASDYIQTSEVDGTTIEFSGGSLNVVSGGIDTAQLATNSVTAIKITDGSVTAAKLDSGIAGDGLINNGSTLSVNVDDSSIEINADTLRVKAAGITATMLASGVAGTGLTNSGTALNVTATLGDIYDNESAVDRVISLENGGVLGTYPIAMQGDHAGLVAGLTVRNLDTTDGNATAIALIQDSVGSPYEAAFFSMSAETDDSDGSKVSYISSQNMAQSRFETLVFEGNPLEFQTDSNLDHDSTTKLRVTGPGLLVVENYDKYTHTPAITSYEDLMDTFVGTYGDDIIPNKGYVDNAIQNSQVQIEANGGIRDDGSGIKIDFGLEDDITITNGNPTVTTVGLVSGSYYVGSQLVFLNGSLVTESTASPAYSDGDYVLDDSTGEITFEDNLLTGDSVVVWYLK